MEWGFSISSSPYLLLNRKRCWDLGVREFVDDKILNLHLNELQKYPEHELVLQVSLLSHHTNSNANL